MSYLRALKSASLLAAVVGVAALTGCALSDDESVDETQQDVLGPPTTVTVTPTAPDRATVSWSAVAGATKYYVEISSTGNSGPFSYLNTTLAPGTSLQVAHLSAKSQYCFRVRTEDGTGPGAPSTASCGTTPTGPNPPNGVQTTQTAPDRITVVWDSVPNATKYYVYEASTLNGSYSYVNTALGTNSLMVSTAANAQECFKVATVSSNGTSVMSAGGCNFGLQPPTAVTATRTSSTRLTVAWTIAANAAKTFVYESKAGGPLTFVGTVLPTATQSLNRASLTTGVQYCYQLRTQGTPTSNVSGYSAPAACATP